MSHNKLENIILERIEEYTFQADLAQKEGKIQLHDYYTG